MISAVFLKSEPSGVMYNVVEVEIRKASDIPKICAELGEILIASSPFQIFDPILKDIKVISLLCDEDAKICAIFNFNIREIYKDKNLPYIVSFYGNRNSKFQNLKYGIELGLWLEHSDRNDKYSSSKMEGFYKEIFTRITTGWKKADPNDYPGIFEKNNSKYEFYIKDKPVGRESALINCIAFKLSLPKKLVCSDFWPIDLLNRSEFLNEKIYMWIKKSDLEEVVEKMGFKF